MGISPGISGWEKKGYHPEGEFVFWRKICNEFPEILEDDNMGQW